MAALGTTVVAMHTGNSDMLQLAKQSRGDAIRLKILTHITIIYLPATLIAVRLTVGVKRKTLLTNNLCRPYSAQISSSLNL